MSLEDYTDKAIKIALDSGSQYCDVRAELVKTSGFVIENGEVENSISSNDSGLGIRVLVNGAWGFYSVSVPKSIDDIKQNMLDTVKTARYYSENKKQKVRLAEVRSFTDNVKFKMLVEPNIEEMVKIGLESDKIIHDQKRIIKSSV